MKVLIEASPLEQNNPSGVNYFTDGLSSGLNTVGGNDLEVGYFWLNFLGLKKPHNHWVKLARTRGLLRQFRLIPQRVYAKLVYYRLAPPLVFLGVDWLLFPNFYIWPTLGQAKKAVIIHDLCYMRYPEYVEDKNKAFLNRVATRSIKKADLIISNSEFTTSELIELASVPPEKIVTLNIPVDAEQFSKDNDLGFSRLEERYGIKKPYILALGTLEPRKNLNVLVEAYCQLPKNIRDKYSLLLVGKWGWKVDDLRDLIAEKQSTGYDIITTGHVDHSDRTTFFRNASFYSITSHYEGFGMPLLEALHCGIPTVAVDIPVLREAGGDACVWAKNDATDIARKLERLITDKPLAAKASQLAVKQAALFSWEKTATKLRDRLLDN